MKLIVSSTACAPSRAVVRSGAVRSSIAALTVCAALVLASASAQAQRVRGTLTDSATREPVSGAVVTISDSTGRFLARVIGAQDGRYSAPLMPGARQMRIVRIGYRPYERALAAADSVVDIRMVVIPSVLAAVATQDRRVCTGETGAGDALALWEQARAGLLAAVVAREAHAPTIRMRSYVRTFEPVRRRVVEDSTDIKDLVVDRSYVAARPAWAFASQGYIREDLAANREYFAPDEAVLLDSSFADTHCLHLIGGRGPRQAQIGIAFEPRADASRDTLVDIAGALWLDRGKLALRTLEFTYTNLESDAKSSGGVIDFATMPNGAPMIVHWMIHFPILAISEETGPNGVRRSQVPRQARTADNVRVVAYRESGGEVGWALWSDGSLWHGPLPRVSGEITDLIGQPEKGMRVWLKDTRDTVTTDSTGAFALPYVFPGVYVVVASDSTLAAEGVSRIVAPTVGLFDPGDTRLSIRMHPRRDVLPLICPANSYKPGTGVLIAHTVQPDGAPAAGAKVEVTVRQLLVATDTVARAQTRSGEAGDDGRFVICGAPLTQAMRVRATKDGSEASVVVDQWKDEVAAIRLVLRPPTS
jgi:hypothetical protein